jgi:hypothetical protein
MKRVFVSAVVIATATFTVDAALASIPDANGDIHGCFNTLLGTVRIIDSATSSCSFVEKSIVWNQGGTAGARGPAGPAGPAGQSVVGQSVGVGDAACPFGGAMFTLGTLVTHACNGAPGAAGPAGPPGPAGAQGAPGSVGAAGPAGPAGPSGPPGATGASGAQGPAGPAGPAGTSAPDARFGKPGTATSGGGGWTDCTLGSIQLFAGSTGEGLACDGSLLPINQNTALFSLLGNEYGGDGQTTFALPDLRSAAPNGTNYFICSTGFFPSRN